MLSFYEQLLRLYYFAKKLQSQTVSREKLHEQNFLEQNICTYNVDEIDPWFGSKSLLEKCTDVRKEKRKSDEKMLANKFEKQIDVL